MKLKVQAQHLKPGDIVGSGEVVEYVIQNSINFPSNKVMVVLSSKHGQIWGKYTLKHGRIWGKYTLIGVERAE